MNNLYKLGLLSPFCTYFYFHFPQYTLSSISLDLLVMNHTIKPTSNPHQPQFAALHLLKRNRAQQS